MLERQFKFSLRIGFNGSQKKAFLQWKRVTKLMTEEKEALGPVFLDELDEEFKLLTGFEKTLLQQKIGRTTAASAVLVEQAAESAVEEAAGLEEPSSA